MLAEYTGVLVILVIGLGALLMTKSKTQKRGQSPFQKGL